MASEERKTLNLAQYGVGMQRQSLRKERRNKLPFFFSIAPRGSFFFFFFLAVGRKGGREVMSAAAAEFFFQCTHLGSPSCFAPGEQLYKKVLTFSARKLGEILS